MSTIEEKFGMTIVEAYGQTESCGAITLESLERERRTGSCGHPLPGLDVKIVDENDIVLKEGKSVSEEEFDGYCRERLAAYKIPRVYEFKDVLSKNPQGKILKRVL
jgi:acyl-coenzyme A synthetase/AMP-(fatty) acid ligase